MDLKPREKGKSFPQALPLKKLLGPSFILLGLGLGSGELILWPYLSSQFGLGIIWAAVLGITFQFFLNMEVARYTLVTGESVFVGLSRKLGRFSPVWFIFSTFIPWVWPGIIAASAAVLATLIGIHYTPILPISMLILIGVILTLGPVLYKTQESLQKAVIMAGVPFVFILTIIISSPSDWGAIARGLIGRGEGYWFLPRAIPFATLLGAFAYAGAGGNLNLAQSLYIKAKGYGMGKHTGDITSVITGKKQSLRLEGFEFEQNPTNLKNLKDWWRRINAEHLLVFWATGALTMVILSLLSYTTVFESAANQTGINFVIFEGQAISEVLNPIIGKLFYAVVCVMLFFTQFSVFGSTSRIMSENVVIFCPQKLTADKLPLLFYVTLWLQIITGIAIFMAGFTEPLALVILGAVLNAFSMFIYSGLVLWLNKSELPQATRPNLLRLCAVSLAFLFYGCFSIFTFWQYLSV